MPFLRAPTLKARLAAGKKSPRFSCFAQRAAGQRSDLGLREPGRTKPLMLPSDAEELALLLFREKLLQIRREQSGRTSPERYLSSAGKIIPTSAPAEGPIAHSAFCS